MGYIEPQKIGYNSNSDSQSHEPWPAVLPGGFHNDAGPSPQGQRACHGKSPANLWTLYARTFYFGCLKGGFKVGSGTVEWHIEAAMVLILIVLKQRALYVRPDGVEATLGALTLVILQAYMSYSQERGY